MRTQGERHSEEGQKTLGYSASHTAAVFGAREGAHVIAGLRGEESIAKLCRKQGVNQDLYYRWSKGFLEAGKKRLAGDTAREATSDEVKGLRAEAQQLKELLAEAHRITRRQRENRSGGPTASPFVRSPAPMSRAHRRCTRAVCALLRRMPSNLRLVGGEGGISNPRY